MQAYTSIASAFASALLALSLSGVTPATLAHGDAHRDKDKDAALLTEEKAFGSQSDPKHVTRTVHIVMNDTMRYTPAAIKVRQGDTVRFIVKNDGKLPHEMVLGTMTELKEHGELMKKYPEMEHDEPHMAHVKPGTSEEMVWHFTKPGNFHFGCLEPGHFEAGMIGKIIVTKR